MAKKLLGRLLCLIGDHDWTSLAMEGFKPDPVRVNADPLGYFREYAAMYCRRCRHRSRLSP